MPDLCKKQVADGAVRVEVDDPFDRMIGKPAGAIRGWFATHDIDPPEDFHFRIGGTAIPHSIVKREDVEAAMPGHMVIGFEIRYDLLDYLPRIQDNGLDLLLSMPEYHSILFRFRIDEKALAVCVAGAGGV